jgi:hypothetical protein
MEYYIGLDVHKKTISYCVKDGSGQQKGNANRATLAVARKMVAYLLAVDRGQRDFVPAEDHRGAAA